MHGDAAVVDRVIAGGLPFETDGCPGEEGEAGCTRPYGSYRPSEPFRDFPFAPEPDDIRQIRADLAIDEVLRTNREVT